MLSVAVISAVLGILGLCVWIAFSPVPTTSSDFAAWAQAVGSVGTIAVAVALAVIEATARETDRLRQSQVFLLGTAALLEEVYNQVEDYREVAGGGGREDEHKEMILDVWAHDQSIEKINNVDLTPFPTPETLQAFILGRATAQLIAIEFRKRQGSIVDDVQASADLLGEQISRLTEAAENRLKVPPRGNAIIAWRTARKAQERASKEFVAAERAAGPS